MGGREGEREECWEREALLCNNNTMFPITSLYKLSILFDVAFVSISLLSYTIGTIRHCAVNKPVQWEVACKTGKNLAQPMQENGHFSCNNVARILHYMECNEYCMPECKNLDNARI